MGLMGFGALWLLAAAGFCKGTVRYAVLTVACAVLIALCRYLEGVFFHLGAYGILAKMRVHLFDTTIVENIGSTLAGCDRILKMFEARK